MNKTGKTNKVKTSFRNFWTDVKDWSAMVMMFSVVATVTLGPIILGLAIFAALVKLVWYILFKL